VKRPRHWFNTIIAACLLSYLLAFALVHSIPVLRHSSSDGDWYYCNNEAIENLEFYGFWPLRQVGYSITKTEHRHISERLPIGLPDGYPTIQ